MHITEHYDRATEPLLSFEVIPPKRGGSVQHILDALEQLIPFRPAFIDVTSHAAQSYIEELSDGTVKRRIRRKRPGTIGLCAAILHRFGIDPVPHLLCAGFTKDETEDALIELHYLGIHNVMALRGDNYGNQKTDLLGRESNVYACDLVSQIADMNNGSYLENLYNATKTDFCIGVAGYPEKHFEASDIHWDIQKLKEKMDAGSHYIMTQMFFDNQKFFKFVDLAKSAGIHVPIVPGLKIITSYNHLKSLPEIFYLTIPEPLVHEIEQNPVRTMDIGIEWAAQQASELLDYGVPGLHFYVMTNTAPTLNVLNKIKLFKSLTV
jgi:methylenetetrahydrofolate reductase (NADPH)